MYRLVLSNNHPTQAKIGKEVARLALRASGQIVVAPLLFSCAKTVSEPHLFERLGLLFERKQTPRIIVSVRIRRKAMEPLEATRLPWAQLRARVNIAGHHEADLDIPVALELYPRTHRAHTSRLISLKRNRTWSRQSGTH